MRGQLNTLVRRQDPLFRYPGLFDCLSSTGGQMSCILTLEPNEYSDGSGFEPMNQNRVFPGSMDQIRSAGTIGRSNLVYLVKYAARLRNPARVA